MRICVICSESGPDYTDISERPACIYCWGPMVINTRCAPIPLMLLNIGGFQHGPVWFEDGRKVME